MPWVLITALGSLVEPTGEQELGDGVGAGGVEHLRITDATPTVAVAGGDEGLLRAYLGPMQQPVEQPLR
jgi:hypothetical protein